MVALMTATFFLAASLCSAATSGLRAGHHSEPKKHHNHKRKHHHKAVKLHAQKGSANSTAKEEVDPCACEFRGVCSCQASLEFMDCMNIACASGKCDCHEHQYHNACVELSHTCSSLSFECSTDKAVCHMTKSSKDEPDMHMRPTTEIQRELKELYARKCKLEEAEKDGFINADNRLRQVNPEIEEHIKTLTARNETVPELSCEGGEEVEKVEKEEPKLTPAKGASEGALMALPVLAGILAANF